MLVYGGRPAHHLDVQNPLATELDLRRPLMEMVPSLDRGAVRLQDVPVGMDEGGEVRTPNLLLPFDDELQVDGGTAFDPLPGLDRKELRDEVPLRVAASASPELAILDHGIERIPFPLVQRVDGLDVVVLVHEQGGLPLVDDHLAEDHIRTAVRRVFAGLETVLHEEATDERRGLRLGFL